MTGKYNPFYRTKPKMIYIPDHWGRLDQGKWVENGNFSPPPKRGSREHLDLRNLFHITTSIGDHGTNNRTDIGKLEALLYMAGVYDLDPTGGPTGYYGERLKLAAKDFQKSHGLTVDGNINPGGETIRALAQNLQDMGRRGGTVLAHLTPEEARFLRKNTDGGSINPRTGLMELYDVGKKDGLDGNTNPPKSRGKTTRALAQRLQDMGRKGDTVLAHLTPEEARFLHENTDGGSINPQTGLIEFNVASKKEGSYIWRTVGDGKVRSSHAERDGKVFSWDNPPEGGHPGEDYNCRCRAEEQDKPKCVKEAIKLNEINSALADALARHAKLNTKIGKTNKDIWDWQDELIKTEQQLAHASTANLISVVKNPITKVLGIGVSGLINNLESKIAWLKSKISKAEAELDKFKAEKKEVENEIAKLQGDYEEAKQRYQDCKDGKT